MYTCADTVDASNNAINQFGGEFQFLTRVTAGSKGRSHKGASVALLRHDHFGKHWFVELDEIAACVTQVDKLLVEDPDNIICHFPGVIIGLAAKRSYPHGPGQQIRTR